eukprot:8543376-Alexandrium_andersonii.AAC.1
MRECPHAGRVPARRRAKAAAGCSHPIRCLDRGALQPGGCATEDAPVAESSPLSLTKPRSPAAAAGLKTGSGNDMM